MRGEDALARIRTAAAKGGRMTALAHHVYSVAMLRRAFERIEPQSAPGVDGVTVQEYALGLDARLQGLSARLREGTYRPKPLVRAWIPKPTAPGEFRAIDLPTVEDKVAQGSLAAVILAVYGHSMSAEDLCFGPCRSGGVKRSVGLDGSRVAVETDIADCFGTINAKTLGKLLRRRIADRRFLAIVRAVVGDGIGIPQGLPCSPSLCAVYLNHVVDRWVHHWRQTEATGMVTFARYVDDVVILCDRADDASAALRGLRERLARFGMSVKEGKTSESDPCEGVMFLGTMRVSGFAKESRSVFALRKRSMAARANGLRSMTCLLEHYASFVPRRSLGSLRILLKGAA